MAKKLWEYLPCPDPKTLSHLMEDVRLPEPLAKALFQRGITCFEEAKTYFTPSFEMLHSPLDMMDMKKARDRVILAMEKKEKIMIYGDYDVDGTTSVSLVYNYLRVIHPELITYIPDRYKEGYGISVAGMDFAKEAQCGLIIALDCGIKAFESLGHAKALGLDVIVCDHHLPGSTLPEAFAILDPKRKDCQYPYKELSGCGVGFKLMQALSMEGFGSFNTLMDQTDILATSIAADIVPLTGENRSLATLGLEKIKQQASPGLRALMGLSPNKKTWKITDLLFGVAPQINACGRIKSGNFAVELLTEKSFVAAEKMAEGVHLLNSERKELDAAITEEALDNLKDDPEFKNLSTTVVWSEKWHKGVIGIVASRLIETYYRPTIVLTKNNGIYTGSARSVKGFDVHHALEQCADLMLQFGGHKYAAGMSISEENMDAFKEKFEFVVASSINKEQKTEVLPICSDLDLHEIDNKFWKVLERMEPFGPQNMKPLFCFKGLKDNGKGRILGDAHIKLEVYQPQGSNIAVNAIGFKLAPEYSDVIRGKMFDCLASVEENEWQGKKTLQLQIRDIRFCD
ncbi:MAG: single-stranded-DNA-specific exonuclease [Sphingobacteriales bacterium]|jgi:single-stranded-DNA-specific exonuclease